MNYEEFIKNYHGFSPFADNIGLKLTAMSDGHCEGEVHPRRRLLYAC